jgi:hypothetical protein
MLMSFPRGSVMETVCRSLARHPLFLACQGNRDRYRYCPVSGRLPAHLLFLPCLTLTQAVIEKSVTVHLPAGVIVMHCFAGGNPNDLVATRPRDSSRGR